MRYVLIWYGLVGWDRLWFGRFGELGWRKVV